MPLLRGPVLAPNSHGRAHEPHRRCACCGMQAVPAAAVMAPQRRLGPPSPSLHTHRGHRRRGTASRRRPDSVRSPPSPWCGRGTRSAHRGRAPQLRPPLRPRAGRSQCRRASRSPPLHRGLRGLQRRRLCAATDCPAPGVRRPRRWEGAGGCPAPGRLRMTRGAAGAAGCRRQGARRPSTRAGPGSGALLLRPPQTRANGPIRCAGARRAGRAARSNEVRRRGDSRRWWPHHSSSPAPE